MTVQQAIKGQAVACHLMIFGTSLLFGGAVTNMAMGNWTMDTIEVVFLSASLWVVSFVRLDQLVKEECR